MLAEAWNELIREADKLDELLRLAPKVDSARKTFLTDVAKDMIMSLPQTEDQLTTVVDTGYAFSNIVASALGYKKAGERMSERRDYREIDMARDRTRRDSVLREVQTSSPSSLHNMISQVFSSNSLRVFVNKIERDEGRTRS